jgi:adenylate kinase family enzyme
MEVTVKLLENAMHAAMEDVRPGDGWADGKGRFLIDGFPRKMDQALMFDETVRNSVLSALAFLTLYRSACHPSYCIIRLQKK